VYLDTHSLSLRALREVVETRAHRLVERELRLKRCRVLARGAELLACGAKLLARLAELGVQALAFDGDARESAGGRGAGLGAARWRGASRECAARQGLCVQRAVRYAPQVDWMEAAWVAELAAAVEVAEDAYVVGAVFAQLLPAPVGGHAHRLAARRGLHLHAVVLAEQVEAEGVPRAEDLEPTRLEDVGRLQ